MHSDTLGKTCDINGAGKQKSPLIGPPSYDNWRAQIEGRPTIAEVECLLYTDAWLTGEVPEKTRPYRFFNLVPVYYHATRGVSHPGAALRLSFHVEFDAPEMDKTEYSRYHGGSITDEVAALASLLCGVRFQAGGQTRDFTPNGDPQGRPVAWDTRDEPSVGVSMSGPVLPCVAGPHSMMPIERMSEYPLLAPEQAIVLVRSARLYQNSLWLSESDPNLSWLLMVSAVESAANHWRSSVEPPIERLRAARPDFVRYVEGLGVDGLLNEVASTFADTIGSTGKFVDFLLTFQPGSPEKRPPEWAQIEWSVSNLKTVFRKIYGYRSKALHDGTPFPMPMCRPPFNDKGWEAPAEKPIGSAESGGGGTWLAKDTPTSLNTFEYIARGAINAWWRSLVQVQMPGP